MARCVFRGLVGALAAAVVLAAGAGWAARPNVVLILADDLGGRDVGCYGSTFHQTPHIDALARRGMRFTQAYAASPLCSPTRSSILTGLAPARTGITAPVCHVREVVLEKSLVPAGPKAKVVAAQSITRLKTDYVTVAEVLREAGYRTGHFGKWHLGAEPYSALQHGFDVDRPHTSLPGPGGPNGYFAPWRFWEGEGKPGDHIEDRMADEAVAFLRQNKDRPFFLNYWAFSVHSPWMAKDEYTAAAAKRADPAAPQRNAMYAGMVRSLDDAVGRLVAALDELAIADRTLLIFTSDNGGYYNPPKAAPRNPAWAEVPVTSNAPFRSGKASNYEGGTRVPLLVVWPGHVAAGGTSEAIVQSTDFFPTLVELLGLPKPAVAFDGVSIAPALRGEPLAREAIYCHFPHGGENSAIDGFRPGAWVRRGDWKLLRFFADGDDGRDRLELYNLRDDVGETKDLAAAQPAVAAELDALLGAYLAETRAVVPTRNPTWKGSARDAWHPSPHAQVQSVGGELQVVSTGNDPWLAKYGLPAVEGPFVVSLRMKSNAKGAGGVYISPRPAGGFNRQQLVTFRVDSDGQWHDYEIAVPAQRMAAFRLDPGSGPGTIAIARIEVRDAGGKTQRLFGGE